MECRVVSHLKEWCLSVLGRKLGVPKFLCLFLLSMGCGCTAWNQKSLLSLTIGNRRLTRAIVRQRKVKKTIFTWTCRVVQLRCKGRLHPGRGPATGTMSKNGYSSLLSDKWFAVTSNVVRLYFMASEDGVISSESWLMWKSENMFHVSCASTWPPLVCCVQPSWAVIILHFIFPTHLWGFFCFVLFSTKQNVWLALS